MPIHPPLGSILGPFSNELYKRSLSGILMKGIPTNQGKQLLLKVHAGICEHHVARGRWSEKPFAKVFTSSLCYKMQRRSSVGVRDANSMLGKLICQHRSFKPSPSPGHSWSDASTWLDPSTRPRAASLTCS